MTDSRRMRRVSLFSSLTVRPVAWLAAPLAIPSRPWLSPPEGVETLPYPCDLQSSPALTWSLC